MRIFEKRPLYLPLYVADYLADTGHLSAEQHGCYLLLILAAWRQDDCGLPNDPKKLARICRMDVRSWNRLSDDILAMWRLENGRLYQPRLLAERELSEGKSISAAKSASARWALTENCEKSPKSPSETPDLFSNPLKTNETPDANAYANASDHENGRSNDLGRYKFVKPQTQTQTANSLKTNETLDANAYAKGYANQNQVLEEEDEGDFFSQPEKLVSVWNAMAKQNGFQSVVTLTKARHKKAMDRIKENGFDAIAAAIAQIPNRPFLRGEGPSGWRANFDFVMRPNTVARINEGQFSETGKRSGWK